MIAGSPVDQDHRMHEKTESTMTDSTPARLGFIGTGTIAAAIVEGLALSGEEPILLSPRNADIAARLSDRFSHVGVANDNQAVLDQSDLVILRSEEHTSELQSLMRISYAVFCLKKKKITINSQNENTHHHVTTHT